MYLTIAIVLVILYICLVLFLRTIAGPGSGPSEEEVKAAYFINAEREKQEYLESINYLDPSALNTTGLNFTLE